MVVDLGPILSVRDGVWHKVQSSHAHESYGFHELGSSADECTPIRKLKIESVVISR